MSYQITQEQYRQEWTVAFQRGMTYLKDSVTKEMLLKGNEAVFPIQEQAPKFSARGANGRLPAQRTGARQVRVPIEEKNLLQRELDFNLLTAQADVRELMQNSSVLESYREIDDVIINDALATATNTYNSGNAVQVTAGTVQKILATLHERNVRSADMITFLWTPMAWAEFTQQVAVINVEYVDTKPLMGDYDTPIKWGGAKHMIHTGLPGMGTNNAKCYAFAKAAVGHAVAEGLTGVYMGQNEEEGYYYHRNFITHGARLLQQSGVIEITHNDNA